MDAIERLRVTGFEKAVTDLQAAGFEEKQATKIVEVMDEEINRIEKLDRMRLKQRWNNVIYQGLTVAGFGSLFMLMVIAIFTLIKWILTS